MKKILFFLLSLSTATSFSATIVEGNLENLSRSIRGGSAVSFKTDINKNLVVECNDSFGIVGLSNLKYVGYNRIYPGITISSDECKDTIMKVQSGRTLYFSFEKDETNCNFFGCKYIVSFEI